MKGLALARPASVPLYSRSNAFPFHQILHHPHGSLSIFSGAKLCKPSKSMAACVDASRTETSQLAQNPDRAQSDDPANKYVTFCRPSFSGNVSCLPFRGNLGRKMVHTLSVVDQACREENGADDLWFKMRDEAKANIELEPVLLSYYQSSILSHKSLASALANHLAIKLSNSSLPSGILFDIFMGALADGTDIVRAVEEDLRAVKERDPACLNYVHCFLNFKGFLAIQAHRVAHKLWSQGRQVLAFMIQSRVSEVLAVDIHPGAKIGMGILLDHATGVVVGETAVIGDNVSILHNVTLGGTGKACGDRHPKISDGVLIGAGTCILGNIRIGNGAKIGAGSVVLEEVLPQTTAVGNPARLVGGNKNPVKLDKVPSFTMDHTSHITEWSDYVI